MNEFIYQNKVWLSIIISLILIILGLSITFIYYYQNKEFDCNESSVYELTSTIDEVEEIEVLDEKDILNYVYIDIKGAVKNPGVYKVLEGSIINDAIVEAGGVLSSAVTNNINLSKIVTNEWFCMFIKIVIMK